MNKKSIIKSSLILSLGSVLSKGLGFFFRIPLIYLIGEEGIGLYQLTYPLYAFLLGVSSGIPIAISKMISERMALQKTKEAKRVFDTAFIIMMVFGAISSAVLIIFANKFIDVFGWSKYSYYSIIGISLAPFFTCIMSALRGYFQGIQYMAIPSASQFIEQIARVIVGVSLAYVLLPYGIHVSAGGASFGATAGSIVSFLFLLSFFTKKKMKYDSNQQCNSYASIFGEILRIAVPISIAQTINSLMSLIDSMIIPKLLIKSGISYQMSTTLFGQLTGKAFVLSSIPLALSVAIAQSTVPAIAESCALNNKIEFHKNIQLALKLSMIVAFPSCFGLYILARPITLFIFRGMGDGWQLLQILSIASIFIIIAQTSTSILNGIGKTMIPIYAIIVGGVIKVVICYLFVPIVGIKAAAYSTLLAYSVIALIDYIMVRYLTKVRINYYQFLIGPIICTIIMLIAVVIIYFNVYNNAYAVLIAITAGIIVYLISMLLTRMVRIRDLKAIFAK